MAAKGDSRKKSAPKKANPKRKVARARTLQVEIGIEDVKRMVKAPGDYQGVARKFADALESTKFRGAVSPRKLRSMIARGERLAQRANTAQLIATNADRRRMAQESLAWKSMLSSWRLIVAAMPDRVELQEPFAFMQDYMSVTRSAPPPAPPQT